MPIDFFYSPASTFTGKVEKGIVELAGVLPCFATGLIVKLSHDALL
ncbi:MAG TPA: hypothetical protein VLA67_11925 [Nitrospiraceae bacterium]|nr:hypothetical protein [Nitrospiraceae bacterium]